MIPLPPLTSEEFAAFFKECWQHDPFPWQGEFARRACLGEWPGCVAVPTGSGKTACLDAAVFALAMQAALPPAERRAGRRIFFIVNRRVIVDEAFERAGQLCERLRNAAEGSVTHRVAARLRHLAGGQPNASPLSCTELRGGIYRDRAWAKSLIQPMIVCSTVDQVGSRLLFRGYGVSDSALPIHAALVAQDSVLIVDEAHISGPFLQTLEWVKKYRQHRPDGSETIALPFAVVSMTATPPADLPEDQKVNLTVADKAHPILKARLDAPKLAILMEEPKAKGKTRQSAMAERLVKEAEAILKEHKPRSIAIMVNRVETARQVAAKLTRWKPTLLIGRMRSLDKDAVTSVIQSSLKTGAIEQSKDGSPIVVVSTQCLEVGADLDFDALVTEAASLDALRQRFGRLNRGGRGITSRAVIVLPGDQDIPENKLFVDKQADPIYGNAIPRTWRFLREVAEDGVVDFGIAAMTGRLDALTGVEKKNLFSPVSSAPVILPAYLDCWVQTSPAPAADPDVSLFLHGPQRNMAEINVCWRADLPEQADIKEWTEILSFCPPCTPECLPVPLPVMRQWLLDPNKKDDESGDAPEASAETKDSRTIVQLLTPCLIWRGDKSEFVSDSRQIRPGDTLILRAQNGGWSALGHIPDAPPDPSEEGNPALTNREASRLDLAEHAQALVHHRACFRIHTVLRPKPSENTAAAELMTLAADPESEISNAKLRSALTSLFLPETGGWPLNLTDELNLRMFAAGSAPALRMERYPGTHGIVIFSANRIPPTAGSLPKEFSQPDDCGDDPLLDSEQSQALCDHTTDVQTCLTRLLSDLPLAPHAATLSLAVALHDWGKSDPRFQAMLRGEATFLATSSTPLLAKSRKIPRSAAERKAARVKAGVPDGWRHEMSSMQLAEASSLLPDDTIARRLTLHLISSHHGFGRPFAPVVIDEQPPTLNMAVPDKPISLSAEARISSPAHVLDSGVAERFWKLNRHFGWWGLPFLEAIIRLADQEASANPKTFS